MIVANRSSRSRPKHEFIQLCGPEKNFMKAFFRTPLSFKGRLNMLM